MEKEIVEKKPKIGLKVFLGVLVILIVVALSFFVGRFSVGPKEAAGPVSYGQSMCLAQVLVDKDYCRDESFNNAQRNMCLNAVDHVRILEGDTDKIASLPPELQALLAAVQSKNIEGCGAEGMYSQICKVAVTKDDSHCNGVAACLDLAARSLALFENDASYCNGISESNAGTECRAIVNKDPSLCKEVR